MMPEAQHEDLLYVSNQGRSEMLVFGYPKGRLVGQSRRVRLLVFCISLSLAPWGVASAGPATSTQPTAAPAPSPAALDPFCPVEVKAAPIDAAVASQVAGAPSELLALRLVSQSGPSIDAHVTLLSDTDAYDVSLRNLIVSGGNYKYESPSLLIALPKTARIRFAYVDSYAVAGGTEQTCPSDPLDLSSAKPMQLSAQTPRVVATFKQTLPPLPCGKLFTYATIAKPSQPIFPRVHLDHNLTSQIEVFLDSNGNPIKTYVYRSSGVQAFDASATLAALRTAYAPEMLLCAPVVGRYLFRADFEP